MLRCYGKSYDGDNDECNDCPMSPDCEALTDIRRQQRLQSLVAKKTPAFNPRPRAEEDEDDEDFEDERVPWQENPHQGTQQWTTSPQPAPPMYHPPYPTYSDPVHMVPVPPPVAQPYVQPGLHSSVQTIPHPAPHLTYMLSNPVDCPMPVVDEKWYTRIAKNVASGVLSESGRQFYEFFRRFRF